MPSRYRDRDTGRWVSKATWKRSTSGRYKRERIIAKPQAATQKPKPLKEPSPPGKPPKPPKPPAKPRKKRPPKPPPPAPSPPEEEMFRSTVSAPFYERTGRKRSDYTTRAARTTGFYESEAQAAGDSENLATMTRDARDAYMQTNPKTWVTEDEEEDADLNFEKIRPMALDPERLGTYDGPLVE